MAEVTDPLTDGFGVVPTRDWRGGLQNKAYFDLHHNTIMGARQLNGWLNHLNLLTSA